MFAPATYAARRQALAEAVPGGLIVLPGNDNAPMNYRGNVYAFRQDGSFLYYVGLDEPGLALTVDADTGEATLYGHDPTLDDVIWEGPLIPLSERAAAAGLSRTAPPEALADAVKAARDAGRIVHILPPYRGDQSLRLGRLLGVSPYELQPSEALIDAVIAQRLVKTEEELEEIEKAVAIAGEMHRIAMWMAQREKAEIARIIDFAAARDEGLAHLDEIVSNYAGEIALERADFKNYLSENISYTIDDSMQKGLALYYQLAYEHGLIETKKDLSFIG